LPTELRRIVFSHDEFRQALDTHLGQQRTKLPAGRIASVGFAGDDRGEVVLEIHDRRKGLDQLVSVTASHVAAALLRYCFNNGVPMPKDAQKSLVIAGDNIALEIKRKRTIVTLLDIEQPHSNLVRTPT
jgi:hypothetical protein